MIFRLLKNYLAITLGCLVVISPAVHARAAGDISPEIYVEPGDHSLLFEGQLPPSDNEVAPTSNQIARSLAAARDAYAAEWAGLPETRIERGAVLRPGSSGTRIARIRHRLGLPVGDRFDATMAEKVLRFRRMHGLSDQIIVGAAMIEALNRGHQHYATILEANLRRAEQFPDFLGFRYVLVDLATQQLQMVETGRTVDSMRVVVGRPETPTPFMAGLLRHVVLQPYWNVPADLVQSRYARRIINGGSAYINRAGFDVVDQFGDDAQTIPHQTIDWRAVERGETSALLRQHPGPGNGMGDMKFMFPNSLGIYLHDTPSRNLFDEDQRLFSAGCIRLHRPEALGAWLFNGAMPVADSELGPEQVVRMPFPVPIYVGYFTVSYDGERITFQDDVYGWDNPDVSGHSGA